VSDGNLHDAGSLQAKDQCQPVLDGVLARSGHLVRQRGVEEHVRISWLCGVNAQVKVPCLVAGMIAGTDSIDDMGVLRHGALPVLFGASGRRPRWGRINSPGQRVSSLRELRCRHLLCTHDLT
jgi:hypothetical protein